MKQDLGGMVRVSHNGMVFLETAKELLRQDTGIMLSYADVLDAICYWVSGISDTIGHVPHPGKETLKRLELLAFWYHENASSKHWTPESEQDS